MRRHFVSLLGLLCLTAPCFAGENPVPRLVSEERHKTYLSFIPESSDPWLKNLKRQHIIFYTDSEMPLAYQHDGGAHSPLYNISATQPQERHGNPNREFPWRTGGIDSTSNGSSIKFVIFPEGGQITYWYERLPHEGAYATVWQYPKGTNFGEMLLVKNSEGYSWTFEVRRRERGENYGEWTNYVYRPFTTRKQLADKIKELYPAWKDDAAVAAWMNQKSYDWVKLEDNNHPTQIAFSEEAMVDRLPPLSEKLVAKLLDQPFQKVTGEWIKSKDGTAYGYGPTADAGFNVVCHNYQGPHFNTRSQSCMKCHDTVLMHANDFHYIGRDWYGRVRGSDKIFSFHIFDPSSISYNGFSYAPRLRPEFVRCGLLRRWRGQ